MTAHGENIIDGFIEMCKNEIRTVQKQEGAPGLADLHHALQELQKAKRERQTSANTVEGCEGPAPDGPWGLYTDDDGNRTLDNMECSLGEDCGFLPAWWHNGEYSQVIVDALNRYEARKSLMETAPYIQRWRFSVDNNGNQWMHADGANGVWADVTTHPVAGYFRWCAGRDGAVLFGKTRNKAKAISKALSARAEILKVLSKEKGDK